MASSLWSMVVMNRSLATTTAHYQPGVRHHYQPQEEKVNNNNNNNNSNSSCGGGGGGDSSTPISTVDWDDWDESLWTDEQRQWLETASVPREVYVTMSIALSLVVFFGLIANATILYVFSRFKRLRTPANVLVMNLTACDFISCLIHPMAIYSAYRGRWSFGKTGCNLYATCIGFLGLNSIVTLSAIACERYIVITSSSCRPAVAKWRITRCQAQKACLAIWLHCAALVAPPWLLGWSSYEPEGVLVTCSWDYTTKTLSNRLYYLYLLFFGFVLPVSVLTYCYAAIFRFIVRSSREMTRLVMASHVKSPFSTTTTSFRKRRRQTDVRTAMILLSLAVVCFTAWTPYAIVSLIGQFGPDDEEDGQSRRLSPMATSIPAFLAKTAIVFDPLLYGFSHPQFRSSIRQILQQNSFMESSNNGLVQHQRGGVTGIQKANANGGTTLMMVTAGLRHSAPRHPQYRSQSLGTSSAAVSWARNKSDNGHCSNASISDDDPAVSSSSSADHSAPSYPPELKSTTAATNSWTHPKRAMSLATIMWGKSGQSKINDAITRGASCQEESYRCFWSPASSTTARLSSVIRSKGDSFYLVDGVQRSQHHHHPPPLPPLCWMVDDTLAAGFDGCWPYGWNVHPSDVKKKKNRMSSTRDCGRRSSEPDLMRRRRVNPFLTANHLRSVGDLTVGHQESEDDGGQHQQQPPIFVVVSLPAATTCSSVIDNVNLCDDSLKSKRDGPRLSSDGIVDCSDDDAAAAHLASHIVWPTNKRQHADHHQLFESSRRRQHSLVFDSRPIDTLQSSQDRQDHQEHQKNGQGFRQHNSLSCPLISP